MSQTWKCACGKSDNKGKFCTACGAKRSWVGNAWPVRKKKKVGKYHIMNSNVYHEPVNAEFKKWIASPAMLILCAVMTAMTAIQFSKARDSADALTLFHEDPIIELLIEPLGYAVPFLLAIITAGLWTMFITGLTCVNIADIKGTSLVHVPILIIRAVTLVGMVLFILAGLVLAVLSIGENSNVPRSFLILFISVAALGAGAFILFKIFFSGLIELIRSVKRRTEEPNSYFCSTTSLAVTSFIIAGINLFAVRFLSQMRDAVEKYLDEYYGDLVIHEETEDIIFGVIDYFESGMFSTFITAAVFVMLAVMAIMYVSTQKRMTELFSKTGGRKTYY